MPLIIAVANQKGGVGKTTITLNLADFYGRKGAKIAVLDLDLQGGISDYYEMFTKRGDELPYELIDSDKVEDYEDLLYDYAQYQIILIDTAPIITDELSDLYEVADMILIPMKPSTDDLLSFNKAHEYIREIQERKPNILIAVLLNMVQATSTIQDKFRGAIGEMNLKVLNTEITNRAIFKKYRLDVPSIFDTNDKKAQGEIKALATEIYNLLTD